MGPQQGPGRECKPRVHLGPFPAEELKGKERAPHLPTPFITDTPAVNKD